MTRKGMVRAAWVIAATFLIGAGAPAGAAPTDKAEQAGDAGKPLKLMKQAKPRAKVAHRARKAKPVAQRGVKPKTVAKSSEKEPAAEAAMSPAVANAKAEMTPTDARGAAEIRPPVAEPTPLETAANEQMNELDRAISAAPEESQPRSIKTELVKDDQAQATMPVTVAENRQAFPTPASDRTQASVSASSGDAWAQSSLIGKIFIACGGLLTLASAARMLIA